MVRNDGCWEEEVICGNSQCETEGDGRLSVGYRMSLDSERDGVYKIGRASCRERVF